MNDEFFTLSDDAPGGGGDVISKASTAVTAEQAESRSRGCLWGLAGALGCGVIALIIPLALIAFGVTTLGGMLGGIGSLVGVSGTPMPAEASVISTETIVQGIQPLGQLVSVSTQLAKADIYVGIGQGVLNACGYGANHVAQGSVEAGIDLTGIGDGDLAYDEENDRYVLLVPAPQLTSCRIDYIRQYDRTTTTCNVDWDEARLLASYVSLTDFRDDAVEGGILTRAEGEARLVLENFIRVVTGRDVQVVFRPPTPDAAIVPPSCAPDTPTGWRFNTTNGNWEK